ncbi:MAG: Uma2 family endonuclease, partial [Chloroflexi bacterium]|nr:Uma2 family endonuclease [Chloroflexota bacterium]
APHVYVWGDLFIYYEEGNPAANIAPDVFVVFGVGTHPRRTYKVWEEGKFPDVVIEIASEWTYRQDIGAKVDVYERLGAREYFLYDPSGELLRPQLQGYRLIADRFQRLEPGPEGALRSEVLGLELRLRDGWLRLWDPVDRTWLPTPDEDRAARQQAEAQARQAEAQARQAEAQVIEERAARQWAEARAAALEAELARMRAQRETAQP